MKINHLRAIPQSGNEKLGVGWGCTYRPVGPTCPPCPLMGNGCYAQRGRVRIAQAGAFGSDHITRLDGCARVRWDVSGDNILPSGRLDLRYVREKFAWHKRNPTGLSLGYTHAPALFEAAGLGPEAWPERFHLLASCHSMAAAQHWQDRGWRTARVVSDLEKARLLPGEVICPFDAAKVAGKKPSATCATCGLCFSAGTRGVVFAKL